MTIKNFAFIGLGSNKGNRLLFLKNAAAQIQENDDCNILSSSSVYETKPYGFKDQDNFLNAVIKISTGFNVKDLFSFLKNIEDDLGRMKKEKWGPREIDLDILFYNDLIYEDDKISVPHKEIQNRDFVILPLCEIEPELIHPALNKKICDICIVENEKCIIGTFPGKII